MSLVPKAVFSRSASVDRRGARVTQGRSAAVESVDSCRPGKRRSVRIHGLTLANGNLEAQARFWAETLGLPTHADSGRAFEVALHESVIRFERAPPALDARYHFAINIPRGRIEEAARWMSERHELLAFFGDPDVEEGATIVHTDRGAAACYFLDGGGNIVELIANDHLDNDAEQPVQTRCSRSPRSGSRPQTPR
jgi:catechol 2,3-dioxygenase-like lactoylglutathione lyase family enzyme